MSVIADTAAAVRTQFRDLVSIPRNLRTINDNDASGPPTTGEWCRLTVQIGESRRACLGGQTARYRTAGVAVAQIFVPLRIGDKKALDHAAAIQDAFRGLSLDDPDMVFHSPYLTANLREENWWLVNVTIPFEVTEHG
jgi:hypothetical protein